MNREQIEAIRKRQKATLPPSMVGDLDALCDQAALTALDAQGGEAVAWMVRDVGEYEYMVYADKDEAEDVVIDHPSEDAEAIPLYTRPSPAAVQALREALERASEAMVYIGVNAASKTLDLMVAAARRDIHSALDAILKEQP